MTLELAILTPALLTVLGLAVVAGRFEVAAGAVENASSAAARAASLARTPTAAEQSARAAVTATLADQHVNCSGLMVTVDTSGFAVAPGQAAQITATVSCQLDLGSLAVPGFPGSRTVSSRTTSVLDTYRATR